MEINIKGNTKEIIDIIDMALATWGQKSVGLKIGQEPPTKGYSIEHYTIASSGCSHSEGDSTTCAPQSICIGDPTICVGYPTAC